jgi:hypothetical protein
VRFKTTLRAGQGELFAPDASIGQIGLPIPLKAGGEIIGHAMLLSAVVAPGGLSVELEFELCGAGGQPTD